MILPKQGDGLSVSKHYLDSSLEIAGSSTGTLVGLPRHSQCLHIPIAPEYPRTERFGTASQRVMLKSCLSIQPPSLGVSCMRYCFSWTEEELLWSFGLSLVPPALPNADCKAVGLATGPALILLKEDDGHQTNFITLCLCMVEGRNQPCAAVPAVVSTQDLRQEVTARFGCTQ